MNYSDIISATAQRYGIDTGAFLRAAQMENPSGDPSATNPNSSASGLFQFTRRTAAQYGLTDPTDPEASADAAARLWNDNTDALTSTLGRDPTSGEVYLAHQQGARGAGALLTNPDKQAIDVLTPVLGSRSLAGNAILNNGGSAKMTAGDFSNMWTNKFSGNPPPSVADEVAARTGLGVLPTNTTDQSNGLLGSLTGLQGGDYSGLGPMLMALGAGIASGSGHGWGAGIGAGLEGANAIAQRQQAMRMQIAQMIALNNYRQGQLNIGNTGNQIKQQQANQSNPLYGFGSTPTNLQAPPQPAGAPQGAAVAQPRPDGQAAPSPQQTVAPQSVPGISFARPTDTNYRNYQVLADNPLMADLIMGVGDGRIPIPTLARTASNKFLIDTAMKYNPNLNTGMNKTSVAEQTDATSGAQGDQINAIGTTLAHMDKLRASLMDLNSGDYNAANFTKNEYATRVGGPSTVDRQNKLAAVQTELNAVRREASKVYAPGGGTVSDVEDWRNSFDVNAPLATQLKSLSTLAGMLQDKGAQIGEQYKSGVGTTTGAPPLQVFSPQTSSLIARMKGLGGGKVPAVGAVEQGYRFKGGNPADPNSWVMAQ